jgi:tetratricopeptide (TPR) repeat protein
MTRCRFSILTLLLGILTLHATISLAAPRRDPVNARKYAQCMELARKDPDAAFDWAMDWRDMGGDEAARHCIGVALIGLKLYMEAGNRLEALAQEMQSEKTVQAGILAQAAQARHLDRKPARAIALMNTALKLSPGNPDLLVDRATMHAGRGDYIMALTDLNIVLAKDPTRIDALIFRATALRFTDKLEQAETAVVSALALDENNPDGLLERGIIRRLKGDKNGARRDWLKVLSIAPKSPAADAAQANLEKMDLNSESLHKNQKEGH